MNFTSRALNIDVIQSKPGNKANFEELAVQSVNQSRESYQNDSAALLRENQASIQAAEIEIE